MHINIKRNLKPSHLSWPLDLSWFFLQRKILGRKIPLLASFKVTYRCNLACRACPFHLRSDDKEAHISWNTAIGALESLRRSGARVVVFEGGEPLLWRDGSYRLHDLVLYARAHFLRVAVTTNGTLPLDVPSHTLWFRACKSTVGSGGDPAGLGASRSSISLSPGCSSRNLNIRNPPSEMAVPFSPPISIRGGRPGYIAVVPRIVPNVPLLFLFSPVAQTTLFDCLKRKVQRIQCTHTHTQSQVSHKSRVPKHTTRDRDTRWCSWQMPGRISSHRRKNSNVAVYSIIGQSPSRGWRAPEYKSNLNRSRFCCCSPGFRGLSSSRTETGFNLVDPLVVSVAFHPKSLSATIASSTSRFLWTPIRVFHLTDAQKILLLNARSGCVSQYWMTKSS